MKRSYRCVPFLKQFYSGGPVAVDVQGLFMACTCGEAIKIIDLRTGSIRASIEEDGEELTSLKLSPDGKLLFSAGHSRRIRVFNMENMKCIRAWKAHDGPIMAMDCHASGGLLATAAADRKVGVWDVDGGFCTHYFKGHKGVVTCTIFHPDLHRNILFSGGDDGTIRVWNLVTKKCIAILEGHFSTVSSIAVSHDGGTLLSSGRDKVVNIWNLDEYARKLTIPAYEVLEAISVIPPTYQSFALVDSHDKHAKKTKHTSQPTYFITAGEHGIKIWNSDVCLVEKKAPDACDISEADQSKRGFIAAIPLSSDQGLFGVTADQQFLLYSFERTEEGGLRLNLSKRLIGYNEEILDMRFLGDDEKFLAIATNIEQVRIYDTGSMSCSSVLSGHTDIILCLDTCVSSSGRKLVVTGSKDNSVRLWDSESMKCIGIGKGHVGGVGAVAFSKKQKNFFVTGSSDRTVKVWSMDGVTDEASKPCNLKVRALVAAHDKDINSLAVAPNDSLVCSGSQDHTACVLKLPGLLSPVVLKGHKRGIWSVEFSPVDQCVITASGDKTVKIWAVADGSCLKTFEGHMSSVLRASFVSRGTQFVSTGSDGLVKLWTVKTNECIATYEQHEDKVWALAVGGRTEILATGGSDGSVHIWHDSTAADKEELFRKQAEEVLREQELSNAATDADYNKAIKLAIEIGRPHKLYETFYELFRKEQADAHMHVERSISGLGDGVVLQLLGYIREWNTKPRMCHVAQSVLFSVFKAFSPPDLVKIKGIGEILEGLIPYSERHFGRADRLLRSTYLLDYTLSAGMKVIEPKPEKAECKPVLSALSNQDSFACEVPKVHEWQEDIRIERASSSTRKRKSHKKVKDSDYVSAVMLQA